MLKYIIVIFCFCFTINKSYSNQIIKHNQIKITEKIIANNSTQKDETKKLKAHLIFINKLSGFKTQIDILPFQKFDIPEKNIRIELVECVENFEQNIKNYKAHVVVSNIKESAEKSEQINFNGKIESEFIHKNPIQNALISINLLNCTDE